MSEKSAQKILDEWKKHVPTEADEQDVMKVLDAFLKPWTRDIKGAGSHMKVVEHPMFKALNLYDGKGTFSVPVHKKKVKKWCIKDIITAIDTIQMMERVDKERK